MEIIQTNNFLNAEYSVIIFRIPLTHLYTPSENTSGKLLKLKMDFSCSPYAIA